MTFKKIVRKTPVQKKIHAKTITLNRIPLQKVSFSQLPAWDKADVKKSLLAFQMSCKTFLQENPAHRVGTNGLNLRVKDWQPACKAALLTNSTYEATARDFFEKWFDPIEFKKPKSTHGLFTGYYMPQLQGSLTKTPKYTTPIYGLPQNGKKRLHYTREQIDNGVLNKKAPVIAWINSPVDRLFLEIEGSGVIKLASGKQLYLGYAGENGAPYTSIASVLIKNGAMTKHNASKQGITRYLETHPDKINTILHKNKSFVFFQDLKQPMGLGARGMALTPGYSLAIDKRWIPLGAPLWLSTEIPDKENDSTKQFQRLMIAQDTGGAIHGLMRGDIYWGSGERATYLGEHMKNEGRYWLLLPKHTFERLAV